MASLERTLDLTPQHLRMARRMVDGWGGYSRDEMAGALRRFAREDRDDPVELAGRLLASALEYLEFALEVIDGA